METTDTITLPGGVETITLQYVLQWLHSEYLDIRWNATRILFSMAHNPVNHGIINNQLIKLIDSSNVYIKNLIVRHVHEVNGITDETKKYIFSKCEHDANFVVRLVCANVEKETQMEDKKS